MKPLTLAERSRNVQGKDRCRYCANTGYVVAQTRTETYRRLEPPAKGEKDRKLRATSAEVDEMAPCPFCERGFYEEFGDTENQTNAPPVKPAWGEQGFWQGRDIAHVEPAEHPDQRPLSMDENLRRMRDLQQRMGWIGKDMPD